MKRGWACGEHTRALYAAYRQHLDPWRYPLLRQIQGVLVPSHVRDLLILPRTPWLRGVLLLYPLVARLGLRGAHPHRQALIPSAHLALFSASIWPRHDQCALSPAAGILRRRQPSDLALVAQGLPAYP